MTSYKESLKAPIRIIMFTSEDCKWCPAVDKIVRKLTGHEMQMVSVTTVDVGIEPEIAQRYNITEIPTILMNEEPVLKGYMSEEMIKDRLWNKFFEILLNKENTLKIRKKTVFDTIQSTLDSLIQKKLIRPTIGDYVHLFALQSTVATLLSLDPLASKLLYQNSRLFGMYGYYQMLLMNANLKLTKAITPKERFYETTKALELLFNNYGLFPNYAVETIQLKEFSENEAYIEVTGNAFSVGVSSIDEPLCHPFAGQISGIFEVFTGKPILVTETRCWGLGDPYCEFKIELGKDSKTIATEFDRYKEDIAERREKFLYLLHDINTNYQNSILMQRQLRPKIGDFIHISVLQEAVTTLKLEDPFVSALLYSAGREFGLVGMGKDIFMDLVIKNGLKTPVDDLTEALPILKELFDHNYLRFSRIYSSMQITELKDDEATIEIYECAYASGLENTNTTYCDFMAGIIAGRLNLLIEDTVIVKEISCHGTGDTKCTFKITIE